MAALAGCTIVSKNYLAYAKTLSNSFKKFHPDLPFYVLLVDEAGDLKLDPKESFELIEASSIGIKDFKRVAFRFSILELNTNVKPSFMKFLMKEKGHSKVLYFDPDIMIASSAMPVFDALDQNQIILTPHTVAPIPDQLRPSEQDMLSTGAYNLGFVGVKDTLNGLAFLDWWADRCLTLGFSEIRTGLFVDQKWCNLVPCLFDGVGIIKDRGWNMAYWNLHERSLVKKGEGWVVNEKDPLVFFHFSGVGVNDGDKISKHTNRFDLNSRPELRELFELYRGLLVKNGMNEFKGMPYHYGSFTTGETITQLARSLYAANEERIQDTDPFAASSQTYQWCKRAGLMGGPDTSAKYNASTFKASDWKVRLIDGSLRLMFKVLGVEKYTILMKYLSYISILRNQGNIFKY